MLLSGNRWMNRMRAAASVAVLAVSLATAAVVASSPTTAAAASAPGPVPVLGETISASGVTSEEGFGGYSSAVQTWETNAEAQVATLRGVTDNLQNQLWSRGEIEADMYGQLLNDAEESNPSTNDSAVASWFFTQYQNNEEGLDNEAIDLYNQWNYNPCAFTLPVATGYLLAPTGYATSYQSSIESICEILEYDPDSAIYCSFGGTPCISTPSASQFAEWAADYIQEQNIVNWGTQLYERFTGNSPTSMKQAQEEALTEYQDAFSDIDEGFGFLSATDSQLQTYHPSGSAAAFEDTWDAINEFALAHGGPEMTDMAVKNLGSAVSSGFTNEILDGDISVEEVDAEIETEVEGGVEEGVMAALGGSVEIALQAIKLANDEDTLPGLQSSLATIKGNSNLDSVLTDKSPSQIDAVMQTFIDLTMPSFTYDRADVQEGSSPVQQGPTEASDPDFCVNQSSCPPSSSSATNTFSYEDWQGSSQSASVSNGWLVQGPGGAPYSYSYAPAIDFLEGPTYPNSTPRVGAFPNDQEWEAWLDDPSGSSPSGDQFLAERVGINAGAGYVSEFLNTCPGYDSIEGNTDLGQTCVTAAPNEPAPGDTGSLPTFAVNIDTGDLVQIGGQVREVIDAWTNSSGTYSFETSEPFDTADTNLNGQSIILLTQPDAQNCMNVSSLGSSRVSGPDCVITNQLSMLAPYYNSETVAVSPEGQGRSNPEITLSAPYSVPSTTATVNVSSRLGKSDPDIVLTDQNGSTCEISVSGSCNFSLTSSTDEVSASFVGDSNFFPASAETTANANVNPTSTTLSLPSGITSSTYGRQVNLDADVSVGAPCVGGTIELLDNGNPIASASVGPTNLQEETSGYDVEPAGGGYVCYGTAGGISILPEAAQEVTFSVSTLSAGGHDLAARYEGDNSNGDFNLPSTSNSLFVTVQPVTPSVTLYSSTTVSQRTQPLTFTAQVSPPPPSGSEVTFNDTMPNGTTVALGTGTTDADGRATLQDSTLLVGTHSITATLVANPDENSATSAVLTQVITPPGLTVYASSSYMQYGSTPQAVSPIYYGFVDGDTASDLGTQPTCSTTATSGSAPGAYTTSCTGPQSEDGYNITYVTGTMTVQPASLYVYASSPFDRYGSTPPAVTASYLGFVNGDSASSLTTPPTCTNSATSSSVPGQYTTSCSGAVDPDYTITYESGALSVEPANLVVTASSASIQPGGTVPPVTPSYSGFVNGQGPSSLPTQPTCSTTATSSSPIGSYLSSCTGPIADGNYFLQYVNGSTVVGSGTLVITASSGSMTYGGSVPGVTPGYAGFANGDGPSNLTTAPTCTTSATSSSSPSTYTTSCSGAVDSKYNIVYVSGTVSVNSAPLTMTALSGSVVYGGTANLPTITPTYNGFVNSDTASSLTTAPTCSTDAWLPGFNDQGVYTQNVGIYPTGCSGAVDPDYTITYVYGLMDVTKAPLSVSTQSGSETYGQGTPLFYASYQGLTNGDTTQTLSEASNTPATCSDGYSQATPVGDAPVDCFGLAAPNYQITYVPGQWQVSPAPLTVTASSASIGYGTSTPSITPSFSGFVNSEGPGVLTGYPSCAASTSANTPSVGTYATNCYGAADGNYYFSYLPGALTVTPADLTITASSSEISYGQTVPAVTAGYSGFAGGDTAGSLTTAPTCQNAIPSSGSAAGDWETYCAGAVDTNYTITYDTGDLTIDPMPLVITASSEAVKVGTKPAAITPGYSGFVNGDTASSLTTKPACSSPANASSPTGTYVSACSGAVDNNYLFTYLNGNVTVNPASTSVKSIAFYGTSTDPEVVVTGIGFGTSPPSQSVPASRCSGTGNLYGQSFYFEDTSTSPSWTAGQGSTSYTGNCVGVVVSSWSATKIVFTFGSSYASQWWTLHAKDKYSLALYAATSKGTTTFAVPTLRLSKTSGAPGAAVSASGTNYFNSESVQIVYATGLKAPKPTTVVLCTATVSATGTYSCSGHIPPTATAGANGSHKVTATGLTSGLVATASYDKT